METFWDIIDNLRDYKHVANFQRFCGVETYDLDETVNGHDLDNAGTVNSNHCECNSNKEINGSVQHSNGTNSADHVKHRNGLKNGFKNGITNPKGHEQRLAYKINNKLVHHMFEFGASLGSEMFYLIFFPFMIWNVDSRLTRHMLLIWYPLMYFGQFLKDWIKWPRPGAPAVRLEGKRFEMEYGMPSTHTIVGTCIPFTLLVLTSKYYEYPFILGLIVALLWTLLVACSRVYLGMHTVLDCIAGISLTALALPWMLNVVEYVEYLQVTNPYAPFVSFLIPLLACIYYPKPKVWSITRGDTSNIVSIGACCVLSAWLNYQLGWMTETPKHSTPQPLPGITFDWMYYSLIRTVVGVSALGASRIVTKKIFLKLVCTCAGVETDDITKQRELGLEVPVRWLTIGGLAVSTAFTAPICFSYLGINREGYYYEVGL
ncbi:Sphingosine-1-phosphate phosphatase 1 [Mactra antiquata]